jgi:hypothetical protein
VGERISADFAAPDSVALEGALSVVLEATGPVRVTARESSPWNSTFPAEAVTCETSGRVLRLWCKYADDRKLGGIEARQRLAYEASVYREVLPGSPVPTPHSYGFYRHPREGWACLVLEHLEDSMPMSKTMALEQAGEWLGTFHAWTEPRVLPAWLRIFDAVYYEVPIRRTERLFEPWHDQYPPLADLLKRSAQVIDALESSPRVLVHGEFFPLNVPVRSGVVLPVDWESAGVGAGEIDLAALTEGWEESPLMEAAKRAYVQARWGGVAPRRFDRRFHAAQTYWCIRQLGWLGEQTPTPGGGKPAFQRNVQRNIETLLSLLADWPSR